MMIALRLFFVRLTNALLMEIFFFTSVDKNISIVKLEEVGG